MSKTVKVVFVIRAALIGAGFASGQEINAFFYTYGLKGIIGLIICSFLLSCIIYKTLKIIKNENIHNYQEFLSIIVRESSN